MNTKSATEAGNLFINAWFARDRYCRPFCSRKIVSASSFLLDGASTHLCPSNLFIKDIKILIDRSGSFCEYKALWALCTILSKVWSSTATNKRKTNKHSLRGNNHRIKHDQQELTLYLITAWISQVQKVGTVWHVAFNERCTLTSPQSNATNFLRFKYCNSHSLSKESQIQVKVEFDSCGISEKREKGGGFLKQG